MPRRRSTLRPWLPRLIAAALVGLVVWRIWRTTLEEPPHAAMPAGQTLSAADEREFFFTAAGRYTTADIAANGMLKPADKYRAFRAAHDLRPQPGDRLCPITRTKANAECTWFIGGREYQFCCPPCIDELIRLAKEDPDSLQPPEAFVKRD